MTLVRDMDTGNLLDDKVFDDKGSYDLAFAVFRNTSAGRWHYISRSLSLGLGIDAQLIARPFEGTTPSWDQNWKEIEMFHPGQALVFALLEPFAARLWRRQIPELSSQLRRFLWRKNTMFGGFFQKLVATPAAAPQERRLCNVHVSNQSGQWRSGA